MKRKLISILAALIAVNLITSTVFAGAIKLSSITFSLGSDSTGGVSSNGMLAMISAENTLAFPPPLIASGFLTGLGFQDVNVVIDASGIPVITCTNYGMNAVPGQSYPKVSASGQQNLDGGNTSKKNGKSPFQVGTEPPPALTWEDAGCPNSNWTAQIDYILWTDATITVFDINDVNLENPLAGQSFTCVTTRYPQSVTCTPVN